MAGCKSLNNIRLAWIRTLSGENTDYRNLQRIEIESFGWAEDDNLIHLQREFSGNTFSPSKATKIYIPKPSGALRPITVLRIRDTIIYQAMANVIAEKARRRLSKYYSKSVFSNLLTSTGYPYFYRQWKYGRNKLDSARKQAFNQGLKWIGELDLASFYDVIDHELLKSAISEFYNDDEVLQVLFWCLSEWTAHPKGLKHGHGIPQGPLPSSFMAECVLHLLDRRMRKLSNSVYFRYVDDITVMSTNEKDATKVLAHIEVYCRELGLVPQLKSPVRKPIDIEDLMFPEPSPTQSSPYYPAKVSRKQNDLSRKIFLSCFENNRLNKADEQLTIKLNYSLFRMNPDRRILKKVLGLLYTLPSVAEAVNFYLRKYGADSHICNYLFAYINSEPIYDFVSAQCLVTIYEGCVAGDFSKLSKSCLSCLPKKYNTILRSTAAKIIGLRKIHTKTLLRTLNKEDDLYMKEHLLFALCNSLDNSAKENLLNSFIRGSDPQLALMSAYLLTSNNLRLRGVISGVHPWATPILVNKGLTKKRIIGDRIGEILRQRYKLNLPAGFSFRRVFNRRQYRQALLHLNMGEGGFAANRSLWVTQMDNFNQIVLTVLYIKLGMQVRRGDEFRSLLSRRLRNRFPNLVAAFKKCHNLRSSNPIPHPYSRSLGTYSRDVKHRERDNLTKVLKVAYQELINKM
ncbi:MAG: reverse transcriptase domain-containing protein [Dehalococcoidia bacterium]